MAKEEHKKHGEDAHGGGGGGHGGGHSGPPHEEHEHEEGVPEWIVSFADNVALMMGFFVILLAMNMGPKGASAAAESETTSDVKAKNAPDMIDLAIAIREAFNNPVNTDSPKPSEMAMVKRIIERKSKTQADDAGPPGDRQRVQSLTRGDYHAMSGVVYFDHKSSALTPRSKESLADLGNGMKGMKLVIEVRGHASAEEAYAQGDRGMRLSFDRAMTVAQGLSQAGVDWRQLRLIPCGDNDRAKGRAYDANSHAQNERVEVIVTEDVAEY
jgi:flagellar motor protein MotB